MKDFNLTPFNEDELPDISLSNNQMNHLTKSLNIHLSRALESNKNLNIDASFKNILSIYKNLGKDGDRVLHSVPNAKILERLVLDAFDKEYSPSESDLIYKNFFSLGRNTFSEDYPPLLFETSYYVQIYITSTEVILYLFNYIFKMVQSYRLPHVDVKNVCKRISPAGNYFLTISIKSQKYPQLYSINILDKVKGSDETLNEVMNRLSSIGAKNNPIKTRKYYFNIILIILIIFTLALIIISIIKDMP